MSKQRCDQCKFWLPGMRESESVGAYYGSCTWADSTMPTWLHITLLWGHQSASNMKASDGSRCPAFKMLETNGDE